MIRFTGIAHAAVTTAIVAAVAVGIVACGPKTTDKDGRTSASSAHATSSVVSFPLPPPVNEATLVSGPVSRLRPGAPIMIGDKATKVCTAGFYIDYPDSNHPGQQHPAFLTAAQCAQGNSHAPVAVMKVEATGQNPKRTQIGEITHIVAGDANAAVAGEPWTIPVSPLAVFSPEQANWTMPVEILVNNKVPTSEILQTAQSAEQRKATATWTNSFGAVVTGHVLDPASTPELRDIPANVQRVVVAADDPTKPTYPEVLGSPVTVDIDRSTYNLGIIVSTDETRHWIVVDLISPFLATEGARLATTS
jgi:hypothetical protein